MPSQKRTILALALYPNEANIALLGQELQAIEESLQRSKHRKQFILEKRSIAQPIEIQRALLDTNPWLVHLCGFSSNSKDGSKSYLNAKRTLSITSRVYEDDDEDGDEESQILVKPIAETFKLFAEQIQGVVLSSDNLKELAESIHEHIPTIVQVNNMIEESVKHSFITHFYRAIGDGNTLEQAYQIACQPLQEAGISPHLLPVLK